jgi:nicotinamide mononucleotide transporter
VLEITATIFGLVCVWLTVRQNIWCWPTGLVMVALYIVIFYQVKLYSDMGLQVIYVFMQIYGWYNWLHGGRDRGRLEVTRVSRGGAILWILVAASCTFGWGFLMDRYTDAALPFWDAATTVMSLIAQWLMAKKILESWLVWISVDILSVGIYLVKGLYPTSGLYLVFLGLATMGFFAWKKTLGKPEPA